MNNIYEQTSKVRNIFIHPKYNTSGVDYDIVLIRLKQPIKFNTRVRPACLPAKEIDFKSGTLCTITGWGITSESSGYPAVSHFLSKINNFYLEETFMSRG